MKEITPINDRWYFNKNVSRIPDGIPADAELVDLPHTWNAEDGTDGGNDYFRGKCLYMKKLSLADLPRAEKYYVELEGANSVAEVYLNGIHLTTHKGGYSTFRTELTPHLREDNTLAVLVDNSNDESVYPMMADFTFYGGIYRNVSVISVHNTHFELDCYGSRGIKVTPRVMSENLAEVDVEVFITGVPDDLSLTYRISDRSGATVAEENTDAKTNRRTFKIENPHLWQGTRDPYLYSVTVTLASRDELLDTVRVRFGIREFRVDPECGFFLNGKPYPLHGVSRHQDRSGIGNALLPEHHEEDARLIAELGANTVRLAHYQHDQTFYDLCDEYGFVVWAEIPYISQHKTTADENAISQMKELVLQNYNHPSICFWGLSNEITMSDVGADLIDLHEKLNTLVKSLDPTRLTGIACVSMCEMSHPYIKIPDVVGYNHYFGWYGGNTSMNGPWFDAFHKEHPTIPICVTEYGCEALDWHTNDPRQGDYTEEYQAYYHEELIKQLFSRRFIFATFVWNMFDFGADARAEGGENGQNHKGLVTFDRSYKKDAFYAYKARLSSEPFVHIAGKRYRKRPETVTTVTVYSNLPSVELFANGVPLGEKTSPDGFFKFELPLDGTVTVSARAAGNVADSATFEHVEKLPEEYILKEKGAVLNWFDVTAPEGYFSLNDEIGEIIKTVKGNIWFMSFWSKFGEGLGQTATPDSGMMSMLGGFTVLRFITTLGAMAKPMSKEELLEINAKLNKIKKP